MKSLLINTRERGLTLIEVLIAVAIISIAMTAIIKATSQNIRSTSYLQNKTIALWVAKQVLNEARVGVSVPPFAPAKAQKQVQALGKDWHWVAYQTRTANIHIVKLTVKVYEQEPDDEEATPIIELESYINHETQA